MRVLHLVGAAEDNGGSLSVIRNLDQATRRLGWSHTTWVRQAYVEVRKPRLHYARTRHLWSEHASHATLFWSGIRGYWELRGLLRDGLFDVVHAHSRGGFVVALAVALLSRRPVVFTNHAYARRTGLYRAASRLRFFYTTVLTPNMARHYGLKVCSPKLKVISECCADTWFELSLPDLANRRRESRPIRFVGLGNLLAWKKWDLIVEALGLLPLIQRQHIEVCIWGPTPNLDEARAFEALLKSRITCLGLQDCIKLMGPTNEVGPVLQAADWFILPSTNEPCSVALIEAMALGLPALVSRSGGNVDIVQEGINGVLFTPEDAGDLARKLAGILNSTLTVAGGAQIRESVRHRSGAEVARQFESLYRVVWTA